MVGSASEVISISTYGTPWAIFIREAIWMVVGVVALVMASRFDYRKWRRLRLVLLVATFVLLLAVLVPGVGVHSGGSSRWIGFGQLRIQPSELMKLALAVFGADLIARREDAGGEHAHHRRAAALGHRGGRRVSSWSSPTWGPPSCLGCVTMALLFASGVPMAPIMKLLAALGVLALVVGLIDPYRRARLLSFLDPAAHSSGTGYQVVQSLIGLGSGHLYGLGLGAGRQKWGFLPNAHTDFIFSVVGEELGSSAPCASCSCSGRSPGSGSGWPPGPPTASAACWRWPWWPGSRPRRSSTWGR